jgi:cellulose 1,4-beta-cellobiosidase
MKQHLTLFTLAFAAIGTAAPTSCNTNNPFLDRIRYANSHYATQLEQTIESFTVKNDTLDAARVRTVQTASTFIWVAEFAGIAGLEGHLDEAIAAQQLAPDRKLIVPFVIYNLPNRDCAAKASAGELSLSDGGEEKYREFVDQIYTTITAAAYEDLDFAVVVEPDSLGNSITNLGIAECAEAAPAYLRGIGYVIEKLGRLENVALYIDAAHSNWLGWPDNLEPTAKIMKEVVDIANGNQTNATNPAKIRGYSTNVSNYNAYNSTTPDPIYGDNPNWSELRYATALSPYLEALGLPVHFIIDQVCAPTHRSVLTRMISRDAN